MLEIEFRLFLQEKKRSYVLISKKLYSGYPEQHQ
jgi:hypothetical protein